MENCNKIMNLKFVMKIIVENRISKKSCNEPFRLHELFAIKTIEVSNIVIMKKYVSLVYEKSV